MKKTIVRVLMLVSITMASTVTLTENSGVSRPNEAVSVGIPLKMGELPNQTMGTDAPLGIAGIPAQFKVLSNWYDGSARFVLATFIQNFNAGESRQITFGRGGGTAAESALALTDRNDTLTINTGVIRVELLKGAKFNMVNRAWRGSTLVVDNSGSGGLIIKQMRDADNDSLTFRGEALTDSFIVEESGPVRSCIYITGRFYNGATQMKASGNIPCDNAQYLQPPPYVRFMVRIYNFTGSDEIKITTVLHNTGQNGTQGTGASSGGPFTFTLLDTMSKTFSLCEDSQQRLYFSEFYYDMKTAIGNTRTVTTENGATATLTGSDRFSFLQGRPDAYYVLHNGSQTATGTQGMGYIDIKNGGVGIAAALKYCWEAYPKRLDVLGDTLRVNLFPRDISPEKRYFQSLTMYSTKNTVYSSRFDSCYHLVPGGWYRSDLVFKLHAGDCDPADLSKKHRNPIMPKYEDQYLHATGAIPGFYSDTLRYMYPAGSLEQRLFERKRIWSGIMYDYDMTEDKNNTSGKERSAIWGDVGKGWDATYRPIWGENNMGDLMWGDGYCNLHYDIGVGVLHSFLRTGHYKAWKVAELMNHRRSTQTVYHHENGHPYVDGHSRYEKDDHGSPLTSNRSTHCWSESMGLYYALTGDPFTGDAFKKSVDGAVWFIARAYARQLDGMYAADGEIRYYGWPVLKLCSGVWYKYEPKYYDVLVHLYDKMIVPMEQRVGAGFVNPDGTSWSQMQGYFVTPLVFLDQTLKPSDAVLKDTLRQMIHRIYQEAEERKLKSGGDNLRTPGYFYHSSYNGISMLDNMGHTDDYAFVWRHFNRPEARMQGLVNAMTQIGYHNRFTTSRDSVAFDYYSAAIFRSNQYPGSETKLHGKIGMHGRVMMAYEYDSLCPVQPGDGSLCVVSTEKKPSSSESVLKVVAVRPNPFNPSTKILFNLPAVLVDREMFLTIYDMQGRVVNRISFIAKVASASVDWNGRDFKGAVISSGVYFAHITGKNVSSALVKLTLVR